MNRRLILRTLGAILLVEAFAMVPALLIALLYGEGDASAFVPAIGLLLLFGLPMRYLSRPRKTDLRAREGFLVVSLAWLLLSAFGSLPFLFGGMFESPVDAWFEAVSGFTTTGATVLENIDGQPHGLMFWRCFTHWIGGMGVLVLTLALLPKMSGRTSHLVRAESPGPTLSKIVPRMGDTAKILYLIYTVMTVVLIVSLIIAGLDPYDAVLHAMSTAGTGGFSNYSASVGAFQNPAVEVIITVAMLLFGVNFVLFYRLFTGGWREVVHSEELRWYLSIFAVVTTVITVAILPQYANAGEALRYAAFQVSSIMSTTGFGTADFNQWPVVTRMLILLIMFCGSCAGSTAGGMKMCRVAMMSKQGLREVRHVFQPRKVSVVRFEGKGVDEGLLRQVAVFMFIYVAMVVLGGLLISFDGPNDVEANLTASLTCMSNVGPFLSRAISTSTCNSFGPFGKLVLSFLMLAGRLELLPILALFHPEIWRK